MWWIFDPEQKNELVERARRMVGSRMCAMCYAIELDQHNYREDRGDLKGRYWTVEEPD